MATLDEFAPTVSVEEAGRLLGLSRTAAYRAAKRGELPTIALSGRMHVPTRRLLPLLGYVGDAGERTGASDGLADHTVEDDGHRWM